MKVASFVLLTLTVGCLCENTKLKEIFSWKTVEFAFAKDEDRSAAIRSKKFIPNNNLPLGLDVWRDKLFVTVPRWKDGVASSLNYIDISGLAELLLSMNSGAEQPTPLIELGVADSAEEREEESKDENMEVEQEEDEAEGTGSPEPTGDLSSPVTDLADGVDGLTEPMGEGGGSGDGGSDEDSNAANGGLLDGVAETLPGPVGDLVGDLTEPVGDLASPVTDLTDGVVDALPGPVGDLVGGLTDPVGDLLGGGSDNSESDDSNNAEGGLLDGVTDALPGPVGDIVGDLTEPVGDLASPVTDLTDGVVEALPGPVGDIAGDLTDPVGDILGEEINGDSDNGQDMEGDARPDGEPGEEIEGNEDEETGEDDDTTEDDSQGGIEEEQEDDDDKDEDDDDEEEEMEGDDDEEVEENEANESTDEESGDEEDNFIKKRKKKSVTMRAMLSNSSLKRKKLGKLAHGNHKNTTFECQDCGELNTNAIRMTKNMSFNPKEEIKFSQEKMSKQKSRLVRRAVDRNSLDQNSTKNVMKQRSKSVENQNIISRLKAAKKSKMPKNVKIAESTKQISKKKTNKNGKKVAHDRSKSRKKVEKTANESVKKVNSKIAGKKAKNTGKLKETTYNISCGEGRNPCGKPEQEIQYAVLTVTPPPLKNTGKDVKKEKKNCKKNKNKKSKKPKKTKKTKKSKKNCVKPAKITKSSPALIPYPSFEANELTDDCKEACITSVFRVRVDPCDRLWVMDTGYANILGDGKEYSKPQILIYNLLNDKLVRKFVFNSQQMATNSFFANIIVDCSSEKCDDAFAYIPDLGSYAMVVYDFKNDKAWRIKHNYFHFNPLRGDYNIGGINFQWTDGVFSVALTRPNPDGSKTAYFHALSSTSLFKVNTFTLQNEEESRESNYTAYSYVGDKGDNSQTSASFIHEPTGVMFYTQVNKDAVYCWNTDKDFRAENLEQVASDSTTMIFPNDLKVDYKGHLWVLTDKLPVFVNKGLDPNEVNYRIFVATVADAIKDTNCAP